MRTTSDLAARLPVPLCEGGCGISTSRHKKGFVFLHVVHYADRRLTVQTARAILVLAARAEREQDPGWLNDPVFDWFHVYADSVRAFRMGEAAGIRLPHRVFAKQRAECRRLAAKRGVALSSRKRVYEWAR